MFFQLPMQHEFNSIFVVTVPNAHLMCLHFQTPEMSSVATSPIKPVQEEQSLTPPGKVIAISTRSPGCARNQSALRNNKTFSPGAASSSSGECSYRSISRGQTAGASYREEHIPVMYHRENECSYSQELNSLRILVCDNLLQSCPKFSISLNPAKQGMSIVQLTMQKNSHESLLQKMLMCVTGQGISRERRLMEQESKYVV